MNTLIMLIAILLMTWLAYDFFNKSAPVLGLAMIGVALLIILWALQAIIEDIGDAIEGVKKRRSTRSGRQGRQ